MRPGSNKTKMILGMGSSNAPTCRASSTTLVAAAISSEEMLSFWEIFRNSCAAHVMFTFVIGQ